MKMNNQELKDAERKAGFINRNANLYLADPIFKSIVDRTVYLTAADREKSGLAVVEQFGTKWSDFERIRWMSQIETTA